MLTYNDIACVQEEEVEAGLVKCAEKDLPELAVIPSRTYATDRFSYWKRTKQISEKIWVKHCEGVCAAKSGWKKVSKELKRFMRKVEICNSALEVDQNSGESGVEVWAETQAEEALNIRRQLVDSLYNKEEGDETAPPTLDDASVVHINALDSEWNGCDDLVADPDNPTAAEIENLGGLTHGYLIYASTSGFHWGWGNGRMMNVGDVRDVEIKDSEKSEETGQECTFPGIRRYIDGTVSAVWKCEFDVVKVCNIPCGLNDKFRLDILIKRIYANLYKGSMNKPNLFIADTLAFSNMDTAGDKLATGTGAFSWRDIPADPFGRQLPVFSQNGITIVPTSCDLTGEFCPGNVTIKKPTDDLGQLNLKTA